LLKNVTSFGIGQPTAVSQPSITLSTFAIALFIATSLGENGYANFTAAVALALVFSFSFTPYVNTCGKVCKRKVKEFYRFYLAEYQGFIANGSFTVTKNRQNGTFGFDLAFGKATPAEQRQTFMDC
jgi:hypothetical protein